MDYFLRPKPAYFTIKRELRPFTVGMTRKEKKTFPDELSAATFTIETVLNVWGTNSTLEEKKATLEVAAFDLHSEWTERWTKDVVLAPNAATELYCGELPGQPKRTKASEVPRTIIVSARLLDESAAVLGRYSNWYVHFNCKPADGVADYELVVCTLTDTSFYPSLLLRSLRSVSRPEPFKYITFPDVQALGLEINIQSDGESVRLSTGKPIKGIVLDVEEDHEKEVQWGDQALDLVPGDPQVVSAVGLNGRSVKARFLGDGSA